MKPQVRFTEFDDCWFKSIVKKSTSYVDYRGKTPKKTSSGTLLITAKNIKKGYIDYKASAEYIDISDYDNVMSRGKPKVGDVLFTTEAPMGNVAQVNNGNIALAQRVIKFRGDENVSNDFLLYYFLSAPFNKILNKKAIGTTVKGIKGSELHKMPFNFPSIEEQQKIAKFLSAVFKKISLLKEKHALLEQYKKGVMQKLFSKEIRFKDENGNDFPDWVEDRLDSFVMKTSVPVKVEPDTTYREIGVRSHGKGVFHKEPIKGRELGNKRVFWVHPKAFIVNIVFAWEHAVALTSELESGFIASHRFPMFIPNEERVDLRYFTIFFRSIRGKHLLALASPGGAGRNKTLGQSNFAELKLTFPSLEEQARIADFYESLNNKAKLVKQQIEYIQTFKNGLLQQMFV
jgi:type I restriction enzyme S subunit